MICFRLMNNLVPAKSPTTIFNSQIQTLPLSRNPNIETNSLIGKKIRITLPKKNLVSNNKDSYDIQVIEQIEQIDSLQTNTILRTPPNNNIVDEQK